MKRLLVGEKASNVIPIVSSYRTEKIKKKFDLTRYKLL